MHFQFTVALSVALCFHIVGAFCDFEPVHHVPHVVDKKVVVLEPHHHHAHHCHHAFTITKSGAFGGKTVSTSSEHVAHEQARDAIDSPLVDSLVVKKHPHHGHFNKVHGVHEYVSAPNEKVIGVNVAVEEHPVHKVFPAHHHHQHSVYPSEIIVKDKVTSPFHDVNVAVEEPTHHKIFPSHHHHHHHGVHPSETIVKETIKYPSHAHKEREAIYVGGECHKSCCASSDHANTIIKRVEVDDGHLYH